MNRILATLCTATVLATAVSAQCFEPTFGTLIPRGANPPGVGDDFLFDVQAMNIVFPMGGLAASYDSIHVGTNGVCFLTNALAASGATTTGYSGTAATMVTNLRGTATQPPRIAAYWRDLNILAANGGGVFINNTIPGKCVVTWKNAVHFGQTAPIFTLQAQLFASGAVSFFYNGTLQNTATTPICGISQGALVADPGVSDLSIATSGVSTSKIVYQTFATLNTFDLQTTTVTFNPNSGGGYDIAPSSCIPAGHTSYGAGCYNISDSVYQAWPTAAAAAPVLSNTALTFTPTGSGYVVTAGGALVPIGSVQAVPTIVANGDDVEQVVPFTTGSFPGSTGLAICSNCFVSLAAGNNPTFNQTVALLLTGTQTSFRAAHDVNPTIVGSGQIKYEESAALTMVTWDGVWDFGGTSVADANNLQMQFYPSGTVVMVWGSVSPNGASGIGHYVGYSPAGPSFDAGPIDYATQLPYQVASANIAAMSLSAAPAPISTPISGTNVTYTQSNIPEAAPSSGVYLGITMLSLSQDLPGTSLAFFGMPGCNLHLASIDATFTFIGNTNSLPTVFAIPPGVAPGTQLFAQSAALVVPNSLPNGQNAFGAVNSNAIASFIAAF